MFSGIHKLGEQQDDIPDTDEGGDIDFIATNFMSPDSGYPSQRYKEYDTELEQHQTLNGVGQSRIAAPFLRNFLTKAWQPQMRTPYGTPRGDGGSEALTPRTAPSRGGMWGRMPTIEELARLRKPVSTASQLEVPARGWGRAIREMIPTKALIAPVRGWAGTLFRATAR